MTATQLLMNTSFDHEKLDVYQEAIRFVPWVDELLESFPRHLTVHGQLDRASASIPLMLVGLIRSTSPSRVHEDSAEYGTSRAQSTD
jgi:hypothetical protein